MRDRQLRRAHRPRWSGAGGAARRAIAAAGSHRRRRREAGAGAGGAGAREPAAIGRRGRRARREFRPAATACRTPPVPVPRGRIAAPVAARRNPLWAWFTGGNALTRIGVVVLFFGVAFLLRYFAEHFTVPIEWRLAAVAAGGLALIGLGMRLAAARPGYGLSLQGAGAGILYLTTYAAFRLYAVLPDDAGDRAARRGVGADRRGSRCAPTRRRWPVSRSPAASSRRCWSRRDGAPLPLFGYFAVAQRRDLRACLAAGVARAQRARLRVHVRARRCSGATATTRPEHFAVVEPFLVAVLRLLRDHRGPLRAARPARGAGVRSTASWCSAFRWSASRCRRRWCATSATARPGARSRSPPSTRCSFSRCADGASRAFRRSRAGVPRARGDLR